MYMSLAMEDEGRAGPAGLWTMADRLQRRSVVNGWRVGFRYLQCVPEICPGKRNTSQVGNCNGGTAQIRGTCGDYARQGVFDCAVDVNRRGSVLKQVVRKLPGDFQIRSPVAACRIVDGRPGVCRCWRRPRRRACVPGDRQIQPALRLMSHGCPRGRAPGRGNRENGRRRQRLRPDPVPGSCADGQCPAEGRERRF